MHDAPLPPKRVQRRCLTVLDAPSLAPLDSTSPSRPYRAAASSQQPVASSQRRRHSRYQWQASKEPGPRQTDHAMSPMVDARRSWTARGTLEERYVLLRPCPPLTPHCLQLIGPGLLDRSIVLYRAVAVCPRSFTAVPVAAGLCKGLPARACVSIFFSPHRLPPRQSARGLSAALPLPPSSSPCFPSHPFVYRTASKACSTDKARHFSCKQGPSSSLATLYCLFPIRPLRLATLTRAYHQTSADSPPATKSFNLPAAVLPTQRLYFTPLASDPTRSTALCLRMAPEEGWSTLHKPAVVASVRFTCMSVLDIPLSVSLLVTSHYSRQSICQCQRVLNVVSVKQPPPTEPLPKYIQGQDNPPPPQRMAVAGPEARGVRSQAPAPVATDRTWALECLLHRKGWESPR